MSLRSVTKTVNTLFIECDQKSTYAPLSAGENSVNCEQNSTLTPQSTDRNGVNEVLLNGMAGTHRKELFHDIRSELKNTIQKVTFMELECMNMKESIEKIVQKLDEVESNVTQFVENNIVHNVSKDNSTSKDNSIPESHLKTVLAGISVNSKKGSKKNNISCQKETSVTDSTLSFNNDDDGRCNSSTDSCDSDSILTDETSTQHKNTIKRKSYEPLPNGSSKVAKHTLESISLSSRQTLQAERFVNLVDSNDQNISCQSNVASSSKCQSTDTTTIKKLSSKPTLVEKLTSQTNYVYKLGVKGDAATKSILTHISY